jgi:hypothetical protein
MAFDPLRDGHGQGAAAPHVETPWKDLPAVNAAATASNVAERKRRGKPFQKGNKASAGRAPTLALLGVKTAGIPEHSRNDLRKADRYRQRAVRELAAAHGYASARACAIQGSAALVLASQRQIAAKAFETGDPELHKLAADLADKHAQLELKADVTAQRAAAARPQESGLARLRRELAGNNGSE